MARLRGCLLLLLPLLPVLLLLPAASHAKFYIGRYKTVPSIASVSGSQARSLPYIVYPGEAGSESIAIDQDPQNRWRVERPPTRRLGHLEPATAFGLTNNYGNDPYKGFSLVHKHQVRYVIPPFTPGGRVHVAFQFWIPISLGGFFVSGRELEAALRSSNPTAYITSLFLKHLSTNTTAGELLGHLEAPVVEAAIDRFLEWVVPHLHHFTGSSINTVNTYTPRPDKKRKHKTWESKRSLYRLSDKNRQETSPGLEPKEEEEDSNGVKRSTKIWKSKRSLNRLSDRTKRQETSPGLEPQEEEKNAVKRSTETGKNKRSLVGPSGRKASPAVDSEKEEGKKNTVKTSTGGENGNNDCFTLSPKCRDENETKELETTHMKTRRRRHTEETSLVGDTNIRHSKSTNLKSHRKRMKEEISFDGATETKHSVSTSTKTQRGHFTEERQLDGVTDLARGEKEEPVQDARYTNLKSRRKRWAKEKSLDKATDLAGGQKEEPLQDAKSSRTSRVELRRHKRQMRDASDGWVTIGGGHGGGDGGTGVDSTNNPTSPLLTRPPAWSSYRPSQQVPNDRLMWDDDHHVITHNDLSMEQDKRPGVDLASPIDYHASRPRPASSSSSSSSSFPSWPSFLTRPTSPPAPSSYNPSHTSNTQLSDNRPSFPSPPSPSPSSPSPVKPQNPFHLTSFDDLPSGSTPNPQVLDVRSRLSRLDYLFTNLHLEHEDCRRRILCEVSREPDTFAPLSDMVHGETRLPGNPLDVSRELLNTAEGARLLSYVEAVRVGEDRSQVCDIYRYRCRVEARQVINTDILPIWREVVRWLTVKVLTQDSSKLSLASG